MNKKIIVTTLILLMSISIFSGCNTQKPQSTENETLQTETSKDEEKVLFEYQSKDLISYKDLMNLADSKYIKDYKLLGVVGALSDDIISVGYDPNAEKITWENPTTKEITDAPYYSIYATNDLSNSDDFTQMQRKIIKGETIDDNAKGKCLISEDLAKSNKKSVGDTITFKNSEDTSIVKKFEISGIYSGDIPSQNTDTTNEVYSNAKNDIYISVSDLGEFNGDTVGNSAWLSLQFTLNSKDDFENFLAEAKEKGLPDTVILHKASDVENSNEQEMLDNIKALDNVKVINNFDGTTLDDGREVSMDIFKDNNLTMVNIWATFCSPCINEMTDLGEIYNEYKDSDKKFNIIGLCIDTNKQDGSVDNDKIALAKQIIEKTKVNYINVLPGEKLKSELLPNIALSPTTLFVDSNGNVLKAVTGANEKKEWIKIIDELLEK